MEYADRRLTDSNGFWGVLWVLGALAIMCGIAAGLVVGSPALVVAIALAVVGAGAILLRPYIGAILFLVILYARPEQFVPQLEVLRLPLLLATFTLFSWFLQVLRKEERFEWRTELGWMIAFAGAMLLSTFKVPSLDLTLQCFFDALRLVLLFILFQQLLNTPARAEFALRMVLALSVVLALIALYGYQTEAWVLKEHGMKRAIIPAGGFDDPNDLAAVLVLGVPLAMNLLLRARGFLAKTGGAVALSILCLTIFWCNSRGGMLALLMALGVFLVHHLGWTRGALLGVAVLSVVLFFGGDRFSAKSVEGDDSAMGRILAWQDGLNMMVQNPFMGIGYQQFKVRHGIPAHNSFVHAFGEGGFYTAVTWVGVNYWAILTLVRIRRRKKEQEDPDSPVSEPDQGKWTDYTVALQAGLMASLTAGMFLSHTYRPFPVIPVALTAALASFLLRKQPRAQDWPHYLAVPALVGVGLLIIYFIVQHATVIG